MTNETEMPELCSPYHDGSMQLDTDDWYECGWGWVYLDDYKDLSDAKDKRIAELKAKLAKAVEALEECVEEIDAYIQIQYPWDDPVYARYRQEGYETSPARVALAELKGETE